MNPYLIIGILAAWGVSLLSVGAWQNEAGAISERTKWQTRESEELRTANAKISAMAAETLTKERGLAAAVSTISADYQERLANANKQRKIDTAAIRAGALRLRDPYAPGLRAGCGAATKTDAGTSGRDGAEGSELSKQVTGDLFDLASDADSVAEQLSACQRVIRADRAM